MSTPDYIMRFMEAVYPGTAELALASFNERTALEEATRRIDELSSKLEAWERSAQEGHPNPCTLGPLCPYCEIERLQSQLNERDRAIRFALGHLDRGRNSVAAEVLLKVISNE